MNLVVCKDSCWLDACIVDMTNTIFVNVLHLSDTVYTSYGIVMFLVMTLGLFGNISTIIVLIQAEHRTKSITYLMLNLASAGIVMCIFGYPVAVSYNLTQSTPTLDGLRCSWLAFSNAVTGISCIFTLTLMSVSQYKKVTQITVASTSNNRFDNKMRFALKISAIWLSSVILCSPPMFGWNRFVPVQSGISCHPDWTSQDPTDKAYIWFLITGGFFLPLAIICGSYGMTYRFLRSLSDAQLGDNAKRKRLSQQKKLIGMIAAAILAYVLSWSPYGAVSLIATIKGHHVIPPEVSIVPELMAKASVIYNPIIYTATNKAFRTTLLRVFMSSFHRIHPTSNLQENSVLGQSSAMHVLSVTGSPSGAEDQTKHT